MPLLIIQGVDCSFYHLKVSISQVPHSDFVDNGIGDYYKSTSHCLAYGFFIILFLDNPLLLEFMLFYYSRGRLFE